MFSHTVHLLSPLPEDYTWNEDLEESVSRLRSESATWGCHATIADCNTHDARHSWCSFGTFCNCCTTWASADAERFPEKERATLSRCWSHTIYTSYPLQLSDLINLTSWHWYHPGTSPLGYGQAGWLWSKQLRKLPWPTIKERFHQQLSSYTLVLNQHRHGLSQPEGTILDSKPILVCPSPFMSF